MQQVSLCEKARYGILDIIMISHLSGTIRFVGDGFVVITVHDVGYTVFCTENTLSALSTDAACELWTHQAVRENAMDLYGFPTRHELSFFELLLSVSGIGPKTALSILNVATVETLQEAVLSRDTTHLTKVSGIGKKNAEKIILELRDKIGASVSADGHAAPHGDGDVMDALLALGYSESLGLVGADYYGKTQRFPEKATSRSRPSDK